MQRGLAAGTEAQWNGCVGPGPRGLPTAAMRRFECCECTHEWDVPFGIGRPLTCPRCDSSNIHRSDGGRGPHGHARCIHAAKRASLRRRVGGLGRTGRGVE